MPKNKTQQNNNGSGESGIWGPGVSSGLFDNRTSLITRNKTQHKPKKATAVVSRRRGIGWGRRKVGLFQHGGRTNNRIRGWRLGRARANRQRRRENQNPNTPSLAFVKTKHGSRPSLNGASQKHRLGRICSTHAVSNLYIQIRRGDTHTAAAAAAVAAEEGSRDKTKGARTHPNGRGRGTPYNTPTNQVIYIYISWNKGNHCCLLCYPRGK